jgi:pyrimidine-nucleoside phosphorylase
MSGRGLGHSGGTLDKLEAIPGFRIHLSIAEARAALQKVGCILIGQTANVAPADKILYALRDVTATVESIPLITASILSKKLAEGIGALVMDVKCGQGAFMKTRADAKALAESIVATGQADELRTDALITDMDAPLGRMVGNALEVREAIGCLRGDGPADLEALSIALAARMVFLGGLAPSIPDAECKVRADLKSGNGLERLRMLIEAQGGDPRVVDDLNLLPTAPRQLLLRAPRSGFVTEVHAEWIGTATVLLGAGRDRAEDAVDPAVGVRILAKVGDAIKQGEPFVALHYRAEERLAHAVTLLNQAWRIGDAPPEPTPLILESVE